MNLKEIRLQFRDMSGRHDLVDDEGGNTGADFYINEAVRWLDRHSDINEAWSTVIIYSAPEMWYTRIVPARAIRYVKVSCKNVCIIQPYKLFAFINHKRGALDTSEPCKCAVLTSYNLPVEPFASADYRKMFGQIGALPDESTGEEVNLIIFDSVLPVDSLIMVTGLWHQSPLVKDQDENFWSLTHPALLINAAIRQTYVTSGNKAMLDILDAAISRDLSIFSIDRTEETLKNSSYMRSMKW